jgi:hypothetical protein
MGDKEVELEAFETISLEVCLQLLKKISKICLGIHKLMYI